MSVLIVSAEVQAARVQDAVFGREAAQVDQQQGQPEEVLRPRLRQPRGQGQQDVRKGRRPKLPLPRHWR